MLKITESNVFQALESMISTKGALSEAMGVLHKKSMNDPNTVVTTRNCQQLDLLFKINGTVSRFCPTKKEIQECIENGRIKLVFDPTSKLQTLVYGFPYEYSNGRSNILVNVTHFFDAEEKLNENGTTFVYKVRNDVELSEILNVAYMVLMCAGNHQRINVNANNKKAFMNLYAEMLINVLRSQSSIGADIQTLKQLRYYINNFFSKTLMKLDTEEIFSGLSATEAELNTSDKLIADQRKKMSKFPDNAYSGIENFLNFLKEMYPALGDISVSNIINKYNLFYGPAAVLAIDYLPYLGGLMSASITKNVVIGTGGFKKLSKTMAPVAARILKDVSDND